mmetsp:Transcript_117128/g.343127  ORF Transcript_117128/g.343127 Transcript_117128/m.343127 type:complete len:107 (-) Transcript_117128:1358-1678(-)
MVSHAQQMQEVRFAQRTLLTCTKACTFVVSYCASVSKLSSFGVLYAHGVFCKLLAVCGLKLPPFIDAAKKISSRANRCCQSKYILRVDFGAGILPHAGHKSQTCKA